MNPMQAHINGCIMGAYILLAEARSSLRSEEGKKAFDDYAYVMNSVRTAHDGLRDAAHAMVHLQEAKLQDAAAPETPGGVK